MNNQLSFCNDNDQIINFFIWVTKIKTFKKLDDQLDHLLI